MMGPVDILHHIVPYLLAAALGATVAALFVGVWSMAAGNRVSPQFSNRMMRLRVAFQAIAVLLFAFFLGLGT
jgi:hypothetical protein